MKSANFSAGCRHVELFDEPMGMPFPVVVMYPCDAPEACKKLGSFTLNASMNGRVAVGSFPLVVISHGTGGSHLSHRTLAAHLARNGNVVALLEHPRNNRNNNELAGTEAILSHRPRQIRLVMDWAYLSDLFGHSLKPDTAAIIGHSLGGYAALATAGGHPTAFPWETPDHQSRPVEVKHDDRVRALVLLAPAAAWSAKSRARGLCPTEGRYSCPRATARSSNEAFPISLSLRTGLLPALDIFRLLAPTLTR
jgi:predicted dienelactone hydrolase